MTLLAVADFGEAPGAGALFASTRERYAPILAVLVGEWSSHKEESAEGGAEAGEAASGLGRVLFQRDRRVPRAVMAVIAACLLVPAAVLVLSPKTLGAAVLLALVGAIPAVLAWYGPFTTFRCHESGVSRQTRRGRTVMRYRDMTEFTYQATRQFVNGAYTGTTLSMKLSMKFRAPGGDIGYSATSKVVDEDLDELRDHIANVIAGRMVRQLGAGQSVPWTQNLVLLSEGLQYRPQGFMGSKPPELLPYERIRGFDMQEGILYVWSDASEKPVIRQPVSAPNFFPGFYALLARQAPEDAGPEA